MKAVGDGIYKSHNWVYHQVNVKDAQNIVYDACAAYEADLQGNNYMQPVKGWAFADWFQLRTATPPRGMVVYPVPCFPSTASYGYTTIAF
jgi:hypothetical protein